eukprot:15436988-Alexandrium_andersonii.AAC.1
MACASVGGDFLGPHRCKQLLRGSSPPPAREHKKLLEACFKRPKRLKAPLSLRCYPSGDARRLQSVHGSDQYHTLGP